MLREVEELPDKYISDLYKKIGANVKKIRQERGISQLKLAHMIGHKSVSVVSCAEICINNYHFNIEHLAKISFVLNVDIREFFK